MASTIITKNSSTASAIPAVGDLTKGELAVNVTDKKVYTKDNSAAIVKIVGSLGNQEANAVAITGGSIAGITDLAVADGGTGASTASDARTNLGLGTIATQAASSVTITGGSVTGITDITVADGGTGASTAANARSNLGAAASGANSDITSLSGLTTALSVAQGGTGITSLGTGVATFLGTPSSANLASAVTDETGSGALVFANTPTLVAPILGTPTSGNFSSGSFTWPTFNQNTTGTAAGLSATLAIASGGTGQTTANAAFNALAPSQTSASGKYLKSDGTNTSWDALDISTADITGTLPVANGGTGVTSSTGTGNVVLSNSPTLVTPILGTPQSGNFSTGTFTWPTFNQNTTGTAAGLSATLATTSGGTGLTSFTSGGVVYASSSSALATGSALTWNGSNLFSTGSITLDTNLGIFFSGLGATTAGVYGRASGTEIAFNASGAEAMRLTSSSLYTASGINVGIGTSSPAEKLDVQSSANGIGSFASTSTGYGGIYVGNSSRRYSMLVRPDTSNSLVFGDVTAGTNRLILDNSGNLGLGVTPSAWGSNYKIAQIGNNSSFGVGSSGTYVGNNWYNDGANKYLTGTNNAALYAQSVGQHIWYNAPSGTAGNAITFTQAMTLDASGNLLVGTTTAASRLTVASEMSLVTDNNNRGIIGWDNTVKRLSFGTINASTTYFDSMSLKDGKLGIGTTAPWTPISVWSGSGNQFISVSSQGGGSTQVGIQFNPSSTPAQAAANPAQAAIYAVDDNYSANIIFANKVTGAIGNALTERARIDSSGNLLVGQTSESLASTGASFSSSGGSFNFTRSANDVVFVNRLANDGALIQFFQDTTQEGSISVSGTTVSYNGGHLSRWAQTTTAKDESIVKGTVLSNLDAMNVYTDSEGNPVDNEQLNKVKVSDTEGDVNVAGVFVNWTHDDAHNVDEINMAMTGDMIIRIAQGVTVVRGDLLMSAGDGTAKPQGDDIVRSKTVAKVTSNHITCTYADGSYCVPCVLMAC